MGKSLKLIFLCSVLFSATTLLASKVLDISGDTRYYTDFGEIEVGDSITKSITLHNNGDENLTVRKIYFHDSIRKNYDPINWTGVIGAGESQEINVTFRPTSEPSYRGALYVRF